MVAFCGRAERKVRLVKRLSSIGKFIDVLVGSQVMGESAACDLYTDLHNVARKFGGRDVCIEAYCYSIPAKNLFVFI